MNKMSETPMTWKDGKLIPLTEEHREEMLGEASTKWQSDLQDTPSPVYLAGQRRIGRLQRRHSRKVSLTILGLLALSIALGFLSPIFWAFTAYFLYYKFREFLEWVQREGIGS